MSRASIRRGSAVIAVIAMLLALPAAVAATIVGGCTGEGHAASGSVNLTTATEWHVRPSDVGGGSGTAPAPVKAASVGAYAAGIQIPIASGTSEDGETTGSVEGVSVSLFAALGARFVIAGSATGDATCNGQITVIIDDVNPVLTVFGGGGLLLALIGLLAIIMGARSRGTTAVRGLAVLFGGLGGLGLALALEQFGILDPTQPIGLLIALVGALLGLGMAGRFGPKVQTAPV
jgi:hypothetical protein